MSSEEAPPPPPPTWGESYGGRTEEATGIIAVMRMISEDITKDLAHAAANEKASLDLFEETKASLLKERSDLGKLIDSESITKGEKEGKIEDTKGDRRSKKESLDATLQKIKDAESGCEYFTLNFPLRSRNRQIEIDGLHKAKAILSGASFTAEDKNRELKPGDAFLQHAKRHI